MKSVVAVALLLPSLALAAPSSGACCAQSTSYLDSLLNPLRGSDESFFTRSGGRPTIHIILDTSLSMADWPQAWPSSSGCGHSNFAQGYDPDVAYPKMWANWGGTIPNWYDVTRYYDVPEGGFSARCPLNASSSPANADNCNGNTLTPYTPNYDNAPGGRVFLPGGAGRRNAQIYSRTLPPGWSTATPESALTTNNDACYLGAGVTNARRDQCRTCLATRGYYVHDQWTRRATGNFLNFFGPRDSSSAAVMTQLAHDLPEVRMSVSVFSMNTSDSCWRSESSQGFSYGRICMFSKNNRAPPTCGVPDMQARTRNQHELLMDSLRRELTYTTSTPLVDAVYAAGHYFKSKTPDPFVGWFGPNYPTDPDFDETASGPTEKSVCSGCGLNAIILLTDGDPNGNFSLGALPAPIASQTVTCQGTGCNAAGLNTARVAKFWWEHDMRLDYDNDQRVATYTVGFSNDASDSNNLRTIAHYGGGRFYPAENSAQLKAALVSIIDDVVARNNAFSAAAISSVQTPGTALTAIVPRMKPQENGHWYGTLHRFGQFNEFVEDTNLNADTGDTDKADVFVVDADGAIVVEDHEGNFVKQGGGGDARPWWEASTALRAQGWQQRNIYTVLDSDGDGAFTSEDQVVPFNAASAAALADSLGILGSGFCPVHAGARGVLLERLNLQVNEAAALYGLPATAQAQLDTLCVRLLIDWVRGRDLGDADGDADRNEIREHALGDIFHSSPVVVNPPVEKTFCQLGLDNQCVATLFAAQGGFTPTPMAAAETQADPGCHTTPPALDPYDAYVYRARTRDRLVLVGANDGMLHAFHDGETTEACNLGASVTASDPASGTGREVWAFIPPDLLPRLHELLLGHTYLVDGDVMVRDIWEDANRDGAKQREEFHTVAVVANGRGGTHYWALDLRFDAAGNGATPGFRWLFPQPCSAEAATFGKTLLQLGAKPPPIGPVLLEAGPLPPAERPLNAPVRGACSDGTDCASAERWVVMVGGGWSPALDRGRGLYMLDVWNGKVNGRSDNLLWKWEFDPSDAADRTSSQRWLTHSVVAPVAMADYGDGAVFRRDGFFDTAVVGDTAGQLWTARFSRPGRFDPDTRLMNNWSAARGFEQDRDQAQQASDEDGTSSRAFSTLRRGPFLVITSLAVQNETNALRAMVGSGNRYALLEPGPGTCRFDNPEACSRRGCSTVRYATELSRVNASVTRFGTAWRDGVFRRGIEVAGSNTQTACGNPGDLTQGTPAVSARVVDSRLQGCPDVPDQSLRNGEVHCGQDAAGHFRCERVDLTNFNLNNVDFQTPASTLASLEPNRFFGVWLYGGTPDRLFEEDATSGGNTAGDYDARRLTDRTNVSPSGGDLVDVTDTTCTVGGCTGPMAAENGWGWVLDYVDDDGDKELAARTATGGVVLASCTLWTALRPDTASTGTTTSTCGVAAPAQSLGAQADFLTGAPNCAVGFLENNTFARWKRQSVLAPPPEPTAAIQLSKTGEIRYSTLALEPGGTQANETMVSTGNDLLQSVYELPISREDHQCRHTGTGAADCDPAP